MEFSASRLKLTRVARKMRRSPLYEVAYELSHQNGKISITLSPAPAGHRDWFLRLRDQAALVSGYSVERSSTQAERRLCLEVRRCRGSSSKSRLLCSRHQNASRASERTRITTEAFRADGASGRRPSRQQANAAPHKPRRGRPSDCWV